jgi:hypothetical protein
LNRTLIMNQSARSELPGMLSLTALVSARPILPSVNRRTLKGQPR